MLIFVHQGAISLPPRYQKTGVPEAGIACFSGIQERGENEAEWASCLCMDGEEVVHMSKK
jgi:hypothetical protein